jgi:hypothetical protein
MSKVEEREKIYMQGYEVGYRAGLHRVNITARQQKAIKLGVAEGLLSEGQVEVIKMQFERFGASMKDMAEQYKVPLTYIEAIVDGLIYKDVKPLGSVEGSNK